MQTLRAIFDVRSLFRSDQIQPTVILVLSALLLTIHRYYGSMEFAARTFQTTSRFNEAGYMFLCAFIILAVIPALVLLGFREALKDYGLRIGDWKVGLKATLILFPAIAVALVYPASQTEEMRLFYPLDRSIGNSSGAFLEYEFMRLILFYTAWEFFFRGFMLFGLRRYVGDWLAICIQTIPSCLWHIGMPTGEIVSSIFGGILFGMLAIRTRSILWPLLLHFFIGVGMDFFIVITV